nr:MAG TPA: hypothetical protein [Caudoviricetes sp.]
MYQNIYTQAGPLISSDCRVSRGVLESLLNSIHYYSHDQTGAATMFL